MKNPLRFLVVVVATLLLGVGSSSANQVTVQDLGFDPGAKIAAISVTGFYTGFTYAGINHLKVDGTMMDGFCIDPYHFSSSGPLPYQVASLAGSPKPPGTMNSAQASEICKLWGEYYSATMSMNSAAGLQIAIWEVVAPSQFSILKGASDYGARDMINGLGTYTGASADLVALTGPGQDYVVRRTPALRVPDQGSTLLLLAVASLTLLAARAVHARFSQAVLGC